MGSRRLHAVPDGTNVGHHLGSSRQDLAGLATGCLKMYDQICKIATYLPGLPVNGRAAIPRFYLYHFSATRASV